MMIAHEIKQDANSGAKRLEAEYKAPLLTFARRLCASASDAEDLVYRTFAEVVAGIDGYTEQSAFFGWMCKICVNCHANDIRRKSNQTVVNMATVPDAPDDGAARLVQAIDANILREAVEGLPPDMKEAILLRYFMDLPLAKIASILTLPIGTVKSRLHYARILLGQRLGAKMKKTAVALLAAALTLAASAGVAVGAAALGGYLLSDAASAPPDAAETAAAGTAAPAPDTLKETTMDKRLEKALRRLRTSMTAATTILTAAQAHAGLLYEPTGYAAQDALILNFDGLRNAGLLKPHDNAARAWVNLANADRPAVFEFGADTSHWESDGFSFGGLTCARIASLSLGAAVTVEVVSDIDTNALISAKSGTAYRVWPHLIGAAKSGDLFDLFYHTTANPKALYLKRGKTSFPLTDWDGKYAVGLINETKQVLVQDAAPNAATWGDTGMTGAIGAYELLIGAANTGAAEINKRFLTGKIKALRVYNRVLTDAEIAANRALDEARFFSGLPVTNVVVATSVPGVEANEPSGVYALADSGHTFGAPAAATVGDDAYTCAGYTLETWDAAAGAWGAATTHTGTACTLADTTAKVRLTWRWTHTAGPGFLDADGYAQNGLILHLDGRRNAGLDAPHDDAATAWTDLANVGAATFTHENNDATSGWTADGYWFGGRSYATMPNTLNPGGRFTVQVVSDVDTNALKLAYTALSPAIQWPALVGVTYSGANSFNVFYQGNTCVLRTMMGNTDIGKKASANTRISDWAGRYVTAMVDDGVKAAYFQTATPAAADWQDGYKMSQAVGARRIVVGSSAGSSQSYKNRYLIGTVKAVRIYDRVLSDDELAANRVRDDARFFGVPPATDAVIVASDRPGVDGDQPCGAYTPAAFTFTASTVETDAKAYVPAGYTLETWDAAAGAWVADGESTDARWPSPAGTGWASRRLTWKWTVARGLRTAADYDVGDYVKKNLVLHVDGLRNVGADKPHSDLLMLWRDLSSSAVAGNNVGKFTAGAADTTRGWLDNGFYFGGATYVQFANTLSFADKATVQTVCDVDVDALVANSSTVKWPHLVGAGNGDYMNLFYHAAQASKAGAASDGLSFNPTSNRSYMGGWDGRYATGMRNGNVSKVFQTATSAGAAGTATQTKTPAPANIGTRAITLASGLAGTSDRFLAGTLHAVRIYDRALTDDELAQNRKVDDARFFGVLAVTNVVVAAGQYATATEAPGVYEVEGAWTFTADDATDAGKTVKLTGYKLEEWDAAAGDWRARTSHKGRTYTYTVGESPAKVRLTWDWTPSGTVLILR